MAPTLAPDPQLAALFSASVDDIWRLEHPPPTPAMVRLAAEAATRVAAAGGGGGRGCGGGVHAAVVCWSSTASVTLGPTWRASSSTASSSCSSRGRTSTGWAASPLRCRAGVTHWFMPGHAGANASARASCRRRPPPTVRRRSSSCARRSAGQRGCTHDLTTARSRPARASAIFCGGPGGHTRMPTPRGTASRRMSRSSSGCLRCSPFVTRSSGNALASRQAAAQRGHQVRGAGRQPEQTVTQAGAQLKLSWRLKACSTMAAPCATSCATR